MRTSRQERISFLSGVENARRELPSLLMELEGVLDRRIPEEGILLLSESQSLREEIHRQVGGCLSSSTSSNHLMLPPSARSEFDEELKLRASRIQSEEALLSLGSFDDLPLIRVLVSEICTRFYELWKLGDTVTLCSGDASRGLMADWYPDDPEQAFEIANWGMV